MSHIAEVHDWYSECGLGPRQAFELQLPHFSCCPKQRDLKKKCGGVTKVYNLGISLGRLKCVTAHTLLLRAEQIGILLPHRKKGYWIN